MSSLAADGVSTLSALLASSTPLPPPPFDGDDDQDAGDLPMGVDEDVLEDDDLDTDQVASLD